MTFEPRLTWEDTAANARAAPQLIGQLDLGYIHDLMILLIRKVDELDQRITKLETSPNDQ